MEKENPFLFIRGPSGAPIRFGLDLKNSEFRVKVIEWIKAGGGTVDNSDRNDCRIKLLEKECRVLPHRDDGDVFSANYIEDCVKENKLLNVGEYRLNRKTIFEDYDPMEIILGKKKWSDLSRKLSAKVRSPRKPDNAVEVEEPKNVVEEADDDVEEASTIDEEITFKEQSMKPTQNMENIRKQIQFSATSSSSNDDNFRKTRRVKPSEAIKAAVQEVNRLSDRDSATKVSAWLRNHVKNSQLDKTDKSSAALDTSTQGLVAKAFYTKKEEISIIKDIVKNHAYNRLGGNEFWKEMERRGVACKGYRSWQSMRERFRKKILPNIHISFKDLLTDEELDNFEKCIRGIEVEGPPSVDTSDNEMKDNDEVKSIASTRSMANRYTTQEDESIIEDIVQNFGYNFIKGQIFWKEVKERGVACKGHRSSQSMRERFLKTILPNIKSYKTLLNDEDLKNFDKCSKGIMVERTSTTEASITEKDDDDDDEIRSNASTEIFPEDLSAIPKSPEKTAKSPEKVTRESVIRKSTPKTVSEIVSEENSTPKKKKRQLWSQNQDNISLLSDAQSTTKAMKRAREDYLGSPKPSTSNANVKTLFKKPLDKHQKEQKIDEDDDDDYDFDSDKSSEGQVSSASATSKGNPYKRSEEKKILEWIIKTKRYSETKGIAMWKILESSNEVPNRSHQSMKERFRKNIAPNIQHYQLDEEDVAKFRLYISKPRKKRKK